MKNHFSACWMKSSAFEPRFLFTYLFTYLFIYLFNQCGSNLTPTPRKEWCHGKDLMSMTLGTWICINWIKASCGCVWLIYFAHRYVISDLLIVLLQAKADENFSVTVAASISDL